MCRACAERISEKERISPAGLEIVRKLAVPAPRDQANQPIYNQTQDISVAPKDESAPRAQELLSYWVRAALNREPKTAKLLR